MLRRYGISGVTQDGAANIPLTQFYDTHTDGSFSTAAGAVPEPSTWAMMLMASAASDLLRLYADGSKARRRSAAKHRLKPPAREPMFIFAPAVIFKSC